MPKRERKVTCPRCHRSIPGGELAEHMRQHKGRLPSYMRATHMPKRRKTALSCHYCGLRSETREEARKHMRKCDQATKLGQDCSICSVSSDILLPYNNHLLCPTCAIGFFESTMVFGSPLINHMGVEYEDIFREKMKVLLPQLGVEKLQELGIDVIVITSSQGQDAFRHSHSPRGELVFMFAYATQIREKEKTIFERVINHEVFHAYVTHKLKLGISDKLKGPFTFMELSAAQLAEDIQLDKIAVEDNVEPLLVDEISRTTAFYENTSPMPMKSWNSLPDYAKLLSATSVTWTYAVESWFAQVLKDAEARRQSERNMKLVHPHYSLHGYAKLKNMILQLFNEKITQTEKESESMLRRLLSVYDEYADAHNLALY